MNKAEGNGNEKKSFYLSIFTPRNRVFCCLVRIRMPSKTFGDIRKNAFHCSAELFSHGFTFFRRKKENDAMNFLGKFNRHLPCNQIGK